MIRTDPKTRLHRLKLNAKFANQGENMTTSKFKEEFKNNGNDMMRYDYKSEITSYSDPILCTVEVYVDTWSTGDKILKIEMTEENKSYKTKHELKMNPNMIEGLNIYEKETSSGIIIYLKDGPKVTIDGKEYTIKSSKFTNILKIKEEQYKVIFDYFTDIKVEVLCK